MSGQYIKRQRSSVDSESFKYLCCQPAAVKLQVKLYLFFVITAILVRIRSEAVVIENKTSYAAKVRKVYKTNKQMKKKPEIRFNNERCNCRTDLSMKEDYLVFGKHVPWNGTIAFLEANKDSFVIEWDRTLEKEIYQLEGHCSLNSMIPTPRMSFTVTFSSGASVHSVKKAATTGMLSLKEIFNAESRILSQNNKYMTASISGLNSQNTWAKSNFLIIIKIPKEFP